MTDLLFLVLTFVGMAAWPLLARNAPSRWRFEFIALDFGLAALVTGPALALLFGSSTLVPGQTELGLSDRLLIASKTAQALTALAGVTLGLSFLAVFGATRILGTALGVVLSFAGGILLYAVISPQHAALPAELLGSGIALAAIVLGWRAARSQDPAIVAKPTRPGIPNRQPVRKSTQGLTLAGCAAVLLSITCLLLINGITGELGTGPYAGILLLTPGILPAVAVFSLILLNINIDLPRAKMSGYWTAKPSNHLAGWNSGGVWTVAMFCLLVTIARTQLTETSSRMAFAAGSLGVAASSAVAFVKDRNLTKRPGFAWLAIGLLPIAFLVLGYAL